MIILHSQKLDFIKNYQNKNIVKIDYNYNLIRGYLDEAKEEYIYINNAIKYHTPNIITTNKELNDFELLCPEKMYYKIFDNIVYSDLIDTSLSDEFSLDFYQLIGFDEEGTPLYDKKNFNFTVTSLYNADLTYNYSTCYVNDHTYEFLKNELKSEYIIPAIAIYVNNQDNATAINHELQANNINSFLTTVDDDFMTPLLDLGILLITFISIASLIVLIIYLSSYFKNEYKKLALYKALGFNKKEIGRLMFLEIILSIIIAFIIDLLIFIIVSNIVEYILKQQVQYRILNISLPIFPLILYFIILILLTFIITKGNIYRLEKLSVRELSDK